MLCALCDRDTDMDSAERAVPGPFGRPALQHLDDAVACVVAVGIFDNGRTRLLLSEQRQNL